MEYFGAFLIFFGMWTLTTILTGFLGLLIPIFYVLIGFILGTESLILGIGGLCGSLLNIYVTNIYIKKQGAMSHAPVYGKIASIGYIVVFTVTTGAKYLFNLQLNNISYGYFFLFAFIAWIVLSFIVRDQRVQSINNLEQNVSRYKIVSKYEDEPKWAIYLYFNNGRECWNETVPGSFCAKNPEKDLTFVFHTKEEALNYARDLFKRAEYVKE